MSCDKISFGFKSKPKKIISFVSMLLIAWVLFPAGMNAAKDSTAVKRKLILSLGYGDPSMIYIDNWINNGLKTDKKMTPQMNPIYAKIEYRLLRHMGIGVDMSYDQFQASEVFKPNTNYSVIYKGYTFLLSLRLNRHVHLIHSRLDLYWGMGLGYKIQSINNILSHDPTNGHSISAPQWGKTPMAFEFTFGARYYVTKRIGIYCEGGIARSVLQGGLCIRL